MNITNELRDLVYKWPTRHKEGFMPDELKEIKEKFPQMNEDKFNMALFGNTCMVFEGKHCTYHCDVLTALRCGLENREMKPGEWD
jgi:hypothetical protein